MKTKRTIIVLVATILVWQGYALWERLGSMKVDVSRAEYCKHLDRVTEKALYNENLLREEYPEGIPFRGDYLFPTEETFFRFYGDIKRDANDDLLKYPNNWTVGFWLQRKQNKKLLSQFSEGFEAKVLAFKNVWNKEAECPKCKGSGSTATKTIVCASCKGRGQIRCKYTNTYKSFGLGALIDGGKEKHGYCKGGRITCDNASLDLSDYTCPRCNGQGLQECGRCDGYGNVATKVSCKTCAGDGTIND